MDITPADHPDRNMYLSNLALALRTRFERTGQLGDLDAAVTASRDAVSATPPGPPSHGRYLSNLAVALRARFERTGQLGDLGAAVTASRDAVRATPADHPHRAGRLLNFGNALRTRFESTGRLIDLTEALKVSREAIDASPPDHPDRAKYLSNLGITLQTQFHWFGQPADLDVAITFIQEAVDASSPDHPDRARHQSNLGIALQTRFQRTGHLADRDKAAAAFRHSLQQATASPMIRARAGRAGAGLAADIADWAAAEQLLAMVIAQLPVLTDHGLSFQDRQHHLQQLQGLGPDYARATLGGMSRDDTWENRTAVAWQRLEQARNVLLGQALEARANAENLHNVRPDLADEYHEIRQLLTPSIRNQRGWSWPGSAVDTVDEPGMG